MHYRAGFSIIELMVTLAVVGILLAVGVPASQRFLESNRLASATNDLLADFNFARIDAMREGNVVMCVSSDGATCTGGSWNQGWIIHRGGTVLRLHAALPSTVTAVTNTAGVTSLTFDRVGKLSVGTPITSLQFSNAKISQSRLVCFSSIGRVLVLQNTADCV